MDEDYEGMKKLKDMLTDLYSTWKEHRQLLNSQVQQLIETGTKFQKSLEIHINDGYIKQEDEMIEKNRYANWAIKWEQCYCP